MADRPKFSVDEMLGSLARWLRIMGYDTIYHRDQSDTEIVNTAWEEGRFLLTRDKELAFRAGDGGLFIEDDDVMGQLKQVSKLLGLTLDESLTRCTMCNGELETLSPKEAEELVPEGALKNNDEFFRCMRCGKVYWKGTHWVDIRARLESVD
ncbi:MAG: hypothetical protein GKC03_03765 [Methanomassiliicoccales archaeon]|nr:hypothetical protein [Methanomassiliicoccales archaeon]NYT15958.1 hypothetical protein [Methanomassiliicoccales archaeon]